MARKEIRIPSLLLYMSQEVNHLRNKQPRTTMFVPSQENCPIPMKYLDCVRYTKTNLESDKECRVEDI
eukprot:10593947-Karenia_brevis.AAC.1